MPTGAPNINWLLLLLLLLPHSLNILESYFKIVIIVDIFVFFLALMGLLFVRYDVC